MKVVDEIYSDEDISNMVTSKTGRKPVGPHVGGKGSAPANSREVCQARVMETDSLGTPFPEPSDGSVFSPGETRPTSPHPAQRSDDDVRSRLSNSTPDTCRVTSTQDFPADRTNLRVETVGSLEEKALTAASETPSQKTSHLSAEAQVRQSEVGLSVDCFSFRNCPTAPITSIEEVSTAVGQWLDSSERCGSPHGSDDRETASIGTDENVEDDVIVVSESFIRPAELLIPPSHLREEQERPPNSWSPGDGCGPTTDVELILFNLSAYTAFCVLDFCNDPAAKRCVLQLHTDGKHSNRRDANANEIRRIVRDAVNSKPILWNDASGALRKLTAIHWSLPPLGGSGFAFTEGLDVRELYKIMRLGRGAMKI